VSITISVFASRFAFTLVFREGARRRTALRFNQTVWNLDFALEDLLVELLLLREVLLLEEPLDDTEALRVPRWTVRVFREVLGLGVARLRTGAGTGSLWTGAGATYLCTGAGATYLCTGAGATRLGTGTTFVCTAGAATGVGATCLCTGAGATTFWTGAGAGATGTEAEITTGARRFMGFWILATSGSIILSCSSMKKNLENSQE